MRTSPVDNIESGTRIAFAEDQFAARVAFANSTIRQELEFRVREVGKDRNTSQNGGSPGPGFRHIGILCDGPQPDWQDIDLCRFFALVFAPPSRECFEMLSQSNMPEALHELWQRLDCKGRFPGLTWFQTYDCYESAYIALFDVGVPEPPVPLFESAHDKSHPAQEIALENTFFYEVLGLKTDSGRGVPDYLVTQLEFLAALRYTKENTTDEMTAAAMLRTESDLLARHMLNWVPVAKSKLDRTGAPGFPMLMTLLACHLGQSDCHVPKYPPNVDSLPSSTQ